MEPASAVTAAWTVGAKNFEDPVATSAAVMARADDTEGLTAGTVRRFFAMGLFGLDATRLVTTS